MLAPQNSPFSPLLAAAIDAAYIAGTFLLHSFTALEKKRIQGGHGATVHTKANIHDVVTDFDFLSQERIFTLLSQRFPNSSFIMEESSEPRYGAEAIPQSPEHVTWYIDPLDGTANFAAGLDYWCISIAALVEGTARAAVIFKPSRSEIWCADEHEAFYLSFAPHDVQTDTHATESDMWQPHALFEKAVRTPLRVDTLPAHQCILATQFPSERNFATAQSVDIFRSLLSSFRSLRRPGSTALTLAEIAHGHFGATFHYETTPWDIAAGALLIEKAGGIFLSLNDDFRIESAGSTHASHFIAASTAQTAAECARCLRLPLTYTEIEDYAHSRYN